MARSKAVLLLATGALVLGAFACNSIIGLDEFKRAECAGLHCDGGLEPDVGTFDAGDSGGFEGGNPDAGKGTAAVQWAHFKMPNYDAGDASPPRPPTYTDNGADIVTENVSGLVWRRALVPQASLTEDQAEAACAGLDPGTGPWRLPSRIELVTLIDYGRTGALIDPTHFPNVKNAKLWSSSAVLDYDPATRGTKPSGNYWSVDLGSGLVQPLDATLNAQALCIKGK